MKNFENFAEPKTEGIDRFAEVKELFKKYAETLEQKRINPLDFRGCSRFNDEEIISDLKETERLKEIFREKYEAMSPEEQAQRSNGKITETIFTQSIISGDFFGNDADVILPSEYDDFVRKVDLIVMAGDEEESDRDDNVKRNSFGLAFDFCSQADDACEKISKTMRDSILKGYSPSIKYGSTNGEDKIPNMWIAKVVLGADANTVTDFADSLANEIQTKHDTPMEEIAKELIRKHPIKAVIIDEIMTQLVAFRNIAYAFGNPKTGAMYHRAYMLFNKLNEGKEIDSAGLAKTRRGDKIASAIYGLIGHASDPDKKLDSQDFIDRLTESQKKNTGQRKS